MLAWQVAFYLRTALQFTSGLDLGNALPVALSDFDGIALAKSSRLRECASWAERRLAESIFLSKILES